MTKSRGVHPDKALSALKVRQVTKPGRYADGNGLYLVVDPTGAKRWLLRVMVHGRRRDMGLGGFKLVSLAEARELALHYRKIARTGGDPVEERRKQTKQAPTFADAARTVHALQKPTWKNAKAAAQWLSTLETYAFPHIGGMRLDHIHTPHILRVLTPIWLEKAETARRVRQRMGKVMDWGKAAGYRSGDNPVDAVSKGLPNQPTGQKHHKALPFAEVPAFVQRLRTMEDGEPLSCLAFELLILTASRTSEVLGARWAEVDIDQALWSRPADRMKAKQDHRVPLSDRGMQIVRQVRQFSGDNELMFPNSTGKKPLSNMVFLQMLKRMYIDATAHGFRSSFRDWAAETTSHPNEVVEMALAHAIENKTEAAYRRGDLLERRRALMADWTAYLSIQR